tara:strand:- start:20932 stop:23304 length:2373 start_codon:yes stop_codon:yes gene_type:complete
MYIYPAGIPSSSGGYTVSSSVMFNRGSSEYLNRTHDASNRDTWTFSTWFKLGDAGSNELGLFSGGADINNSTRLVLDANRKLKFQHFDSGSTAYDLITTQVFRDTSAWYHVVLAVDTTIADGSANNRIRMYVNGSEITSFGTRNNPSQNTDTDVNTADVHLVGSDEQPNYFNGYLAETVFIDGAQLAASSFGETNDANIWVPIDVSGLTFGTNGFHLNYSNPSALGTDASGEGHNWTVNTLEAADQVEDSPTNDADNDVGNYATFNPLGGAGPSLSVPANWTLSNGNLKAVSAGGGWDCIQANMDFPTTGKWAVKFIWVSGVHGQVHVGHRLSTGAGDSGAKWSLNESKMETNNGGETSASYAYTKGNVGECLYDVDAGTVKFYQSGSLVYTHTGVTRSLATTFGVWTYHPGGVGTWTVDFGQLGYTPTDTDYLPLCTGRFPEPTITKPSDHFQTALIDTHGGSSETVTCNWSLDTYDTLVMAKAVNTSDIWYFADGLRGYNKFSNLNSSGSNSGEGDNANMFAVSGTTLTLGSYWSSGDIVYVAMWKMGAAGGSSNTDGTNISSTVAVNSTAKQGIGLYEGTGNSGDSMGHGLGVIPDYWWCSGRDSSASNPVQHSKCLVGGSPGDNALLMEETDIANNHPAYWNDVDATASTVTFQANNATNGDGRLYAGYAFSDVEGYCRTFAYEGNGAASGSFIYLGFRPAMIWLKSADSTSDWHCYNSLRLGYNADNNRSNLNGSASTKTEITADEIDILSNGFKLRITTDPNVAETYVGIAWAETPLASNNRAR